MIATAYILSTPTEIEIRRRPDRENRAGCLRSLHQQNGLVDRRDQTDGRRENDQIRWPCGRPGFKRSAWDLPARVGRYPWPEKSGLQWLTNNRVC